MHSKPELRQTILETERLLLKGLNQEVIYNLFTYYTDEEIMAFMGLHTENELELERIKFEGGRTTYRTSFITFVMVDKISNKAIGKVGFHNWYIHHFRSEFGYNISDDNFLRQGYMTEAVKALVEYGFRTMGLNRMEAFTGTDNIPSRKMLENLGFKQEGILKEHYFIDNRMHDSVCYALLLKEYNRQKI